jgi:hypothetical protein
MFNEVAHTLFFDDYSREPPWGSSISLDNPVGGFADPWLGYPGGNPFPTKLDKNATFPTNAYWETTPLDLKTTYVHQFNFSIQRQLGPNWLASASYLGNSTIHLWTDREQDPAIYLPDPTCVLNGVPYTPCSTVANTLRRRVFSLENQSQGQYFGTMNLLDDGGTASFHGMLLSLQHRLANNFTVLGNYTWSHCISDLVTTELAGPAYTNPNNRRSDRGNCRFVDVRHIFNLSVVANSPKFSDRWMQAIAGDWQLSVIAGAKSGSYFGVTTGVDNALTGVGQQRPNQVNPDPYCPNRNPSCWVNFGAFANPATGTLGNLGYGNLIGPGYFNLDVGLVRVFPITERHRIQIRAEAFNIQNRANFGNPATVTYPYGPGAVMTSATFGKILTANPPRIMQFALKYMF